MRVLYLECDMGAAGDMLTAALLELLPEREAFLEKLNHVGIPGVCYLAETLEKCGIRGTHVTVKVNGQEEGDCLCGATYLKAETHVHGQAQIHEQGHVQEHAHVQGQTHIQELEHIHECNNRLGDKYIVEKHPKHSHAVSSSCSRMQDITKLVECFQISEAVKQDILAVYQLLAEAESHVHGVPVEEIHFHEVGNLDAVADITAVCLLMDELKSEQVVVSPVHVGCGQVRCAHGILPVPAPATARLLQGVPIYGGAIQGELCTPTGAALLKYFATNFGSMPVMSVSGIGYGMGKKDFEVANCVRAFFGEILDAKTDAEADGARGKTAVKAANVMEENVTYGSADAEADATRDRTADEITGKAKEMESGEDYEVYELSCNVDDMTGEEIGFAMEELFAGGALDVFTIPIGMKKCRPGTLIQVLCHASEKEKMRDLMFRYTSTIGIRETICKRYRLEREINLLSTPYGTIRRKDSFGYGVRRSKYEYEDVAKMAREEGCSISEMLHLLESTELQKDK